MRPAYQPGDRVLVRRRGRRPVRRGDVVVLRVRQRAGPDRLAGGPWLIKRAAAVPGDPNPVAGTAHVPGGSSPTVPDGWLAVLGDNATASTDSRQFGLVHEDDVLGTVLRRLPGSGPLSRADRRSADPGLAFRGS
jgi:signal peptidase I